MRNHNAKAQEVVIKISGPLKYQKCINCGAKYIVLKLHKAKDRYDWSDKVSGDTCPYCARKHNPRKGRPL